VGRAVIFDLDGTLADSMEAYGQYASTLMADTYSISLTSALRGYFATAGMPFGDQLQALFPNHPSNRLVARSFAEFKEDYQDAIHLYDDAIAACRTLKDCGYGVAVCSSTDVPLVLHLLKTRGILSLIDNISGQDARNLSKLQRLQALVELFKGPVTFVGDTVYDADVAKRANINFVGVTHTIDGQSFAALNVPFAATLTAVVQRIVKHGN
jgi:phosphoglycolate phosphatase-like HAD superfamily hydrolase